MVKVSDGIYTNLSAAALEEIVGPIESIDSWYPYWNPIEGKWEL